MSYVCYIWKYSSSANGADDLNKQFLLKSLWFPVFLVLGTEKVVSVNFKDCCAPIDLCLFL